MKKSTIIGALALCLMFPLASMAQDGYSDSGTAKFGVKVGGNLTNFYSGDNINDNNLKPGFQAGIYFQAHIIEDVLFIQPEVLYTRKGTQATYSNFLQGSGKYQFGLGYVEVPVVLGVNIGNFNIHAGGYGAYLTDARVRDVNNNGDIRGATDLNRGNFNSLDYGLVGGIGADFEFGQIGLRYNYGLREIGDSGIAGQLTQNAKNQALQLYVGFHF